MENAEKSKAINKKYIVIPLLRTINDSYGAISFYKDILKNWDHYVLIVKI